MGFDPSKFRTAKGKNCRETMFAAQVLRNHPHRRGNCERGLKPSLVEACSFGVRVIASQKLPRDSGESIFTTRHLDVSQGPMGTTPNSKDSFAVQTHKRTFELANRGLWIGFLESGGANFVGNFLSGGNGKWGISMPL